MVNFLIKSKQIKKNIVILFYFSSFEPPISKSTLLSDILIIIKI